MNNKKPDISEDVLIHRERSPSGILRMDSGRLRRLSTDFKPYQHEPTSPQPSVDRLSVTFAEDPCREKTTKVFFPLTEISVARMEKPTTSQLVENDTDVKENHESDQEDYSASMNAIIQRRASTRRSKPKNRRSSSPFTSDVVPNNDELRRRSSVFTTSSGETAITIEENLNNEATQDEICEMIKLHKEVLSNVKFQPWSMRKKLKLIRQARAYIKKHEGELQVRLAQSHSTKDMVARWKMYVVKKWQKWKSEIINYSLWLIPWELKIKEIESHFGSVVASYFIFLRWLFWVNIVIAVVLISFVTIPEIITADPQTDKERKFVLEEEKYNATNFLTLWDFEGAFKYSPLFYGWYTYKDNNGSAILGDGKGKGNGYRLPFAYFVTGVLVYAYSFFAILRKMAENSRASRLSEKDDECNFSVKLFTAWDFTIGNPETAHNRVASIVMGFKEALLEEVEKKREPKNWKIICLRILVNLLVIGMLSCSAGVVIFVVKRSNEPEAQSTLWRRNESTLVITLISNTFPFLFEILGILEQYHPRKTLQVQLARIMVLNLLNLYSLVFSTLSKISEMSLLYYLIEGTNSSGDLMVIPTKFPNLNQSCFCTEILLKNDRYNLLESENLLAESNLAKSLISQNILATTNVTELTNIVVENLTDILQNLTEHITDTVNLSEIGYNFTEHVTELAENASLSTIWEKYSPTNISTENSTTVTNFFTESVTETSNENLTFWDNTTIIFENVTEAIYENFTDLEFNETTTNDDFVDYLTYILGPFSFVWKTNFSNNTDFEFNVSTTEVSDTLSNITMVENSFSTGFSTDILTSNIVTNLSTLNISELDFGEEISTSFNKEFTTDFEKQLISSTDSAIMNVFDRLTNTEEISTKLLTISSTSINPMTTTFLTTPNETNNSLCTCNTQSNIPATKDTFLASNITISSTVKKQLEEYRKSSEYEKEYKKRSLCWETMFGQELIKLTVMDLLGTVGVAFGLDFFRGIFVRVMNNCWCWDLEKKFPQYGDFKVAENILHLVNNQGMVWMGMFFSPGLVALNVIKLYVMMYFRSWVVLTCNVPPTVIFRASRSNNFYYALLLMMLFLCVLPVSYAVVWVEPSLHCGPFSGYCKIFHIFTKTVRAKIPPAFHWVLEYIASPGIVIPLLLLLVLIIYYLTSLTSALKEANDDLKIQLKQERTEERRKMFKLAAKRRRAANLGESNDLSGTTPFTKWKKLLGDLPSGKSHDDTQDTPKQESEEAKEEEQNKLPESKSKVFFSKLIKKALGKSSTSDEDQDNTDNEQHDSLPYDVNRSSLHTPVNRSVSNGSFDLQSIVHKTWNIRKKEKIEEGTKEEITTNTNKSNTIIIKPMTSTTDEKLVEETKIIIENTKINSLDSDASSVWSELIPVIKISKTESDENILNKCRTSPDCITENEKEVSSKYMNGENIKCAKEVGELNINKQIEETEDKLKNINKKSVKTCDKFQSTKPKIKCALKKQSTEIDEDLIFYFDKDIQKMRQEDDFVKMLAEQKITEDVNSPNKQDLSREEILLSEKSSSEGTEDKGETSSSIQTAFNISLKSNDGSFKNLE